MDLSRVKPSKNFVDIRFQQSTDRMLNALLATQDPMLMLQGGVGPDKNAYGKYLQDQFSHVTPEDLKALKSGATLEDLAFIRALKHFGIHNDAMTDWQFRKLFYGRP